MAGELGVAGAPGEWDAWMFFSSEKSCLITSKKLLNGLPTQTGRKEETERENKQQMSNEVNVTGGGDGGMRGGVELEERRLFSRQGWSGWRKERWRQKEPIQVKLCRIVNR